MIVPLIEGPPDASMTDGIDRLWLQLWQARQSGTLAGQGALIDALAAELGQQHPSVLRWHVWRTASGIAH